MTSITPHGRLRNRTIGVALVGFVALTIIADPVAAADASSDASGITGVFEYFRAIVTVVGAAASSVYLTIQLAMIGVSSQGTSERWKKVGVSGLVTVLLLSWNKTVQEVLTGAEGAATATLAPPSGAFTAIHMATLDTMATLIVAIPI